MIWLGVGCVVVFVGVMVWSLCQMAGKGDREEDQ